MTATREPVAGRPAPGRPGTRDAPAGGSAARAPGRARRPRRAPRVGRHVGRLLDRTPLAISRLARLLGLLAFVDALFPHRWSFLTALTPMLPAPERAATDAVTVVSGLVMLRIASGLRRRKRAEWRLAVIVCGVLIAADLLRGGRRPVEALITVVLLALLVAGRRRFTALADPHGAWFAVRAAVEVAAVGFAYGLVLLLLPGHVRNGVTVPQRLWEVATSLAGMGGWISVQDEAYADFVHATLLAFGLAAVGAALWVALRPAQPRPHLDADDEQRLRRLLARQGGRDSLAYFALRRDKSVVWSRSGKAAIAYRVVGGVALMSGDPVGDPEAWPGAITAYTALCTRNGWVPAALGAGEQGATSLRRHAGLRALELGDEAVVHADRFTLDGREMRGVRQASARILRAGYDVRVRRMRDVPDQERDVLRACADTWRLDKVERGFSMALSRFGDPADGDCVLVTATQHGRLRGMLHFVPWGADGLSLDLMRREHDSDNGLSEHMIVVLIGELPRLGVARVSLNFATFRSALEQGQRIGAGPVLRAWRRVLLVASRVWQIESLYRFNAKFRPEWRPRFLSYPSASDLPRIAVAALEAEQFIVRPPVLRRRSARDVSRAR